MAGYRSHSAADIWCHHELDAWPAGWTLDRLSLTVEPLLRQEQRRRKDADR